MIIFIEFFFGYLGDSRLYLAILGLVFDVTRGAKVIFEVTNKKTTSKVSLFFQHYGPGNIATNIFVNCHRTLCSSC